MQEIMHEGFKIGAPFKTRHREVAPNQYECAPFFGIANTQIDENLLLMQLIEEIPQKYGLVGLLMEKPFNGVNGSGKHNNFSLGTRDGVNLFNGPQLTKKSGNADLFAIVMAGVSAIHKSYHAPRCRVPQCVYHVLRNHMAGRFHYHLHRHPGCRL